MRTRFSERLLASAITTIGLFLLPVATFGVAEYGPAGRVTISQYLPLEDVAVALLAAGVGAAWAARLLAIRFGEPPLSTFRLTLGALIGTGFGLVSGLVFAVGVADKTVPELVWTTAVVASLLGSWGGAALLYARAASGVLEIVVRFARLGGAALLALWVLVPTLRAFPTHGDVDARAAWASERVPDWPWLVGVVSAMPDVIQDVGPVKVVALAPGDAHRAGREMDGTRFLVVLEVVGERGRGTLQVDALLSGDRVLSSVRGPWTSERGTRELHWPPPAPTEPASDTK